MIRKSNKISVAMCTFDGDGFVQEQLESIINQTRPPDEIVICDDHSSDGTVQIIRNILAKISISCMLIENERNLGVNKNFEKAIRYCTGNIIFTADQDDCWLEDKIEFVESQFNANAKTLLVFTDGHVVDENLKSLNSNLWDVFHFPFEKDVTGNMSLLELLLNRNVVTGATMAFRSELCELILPFGEGWFFDHWIAIIATIRGGVQALPEKAIKYRMHGKNVVGATKEAYLLRLKKYFSNYSKAFLSRKRNIYYEMLSQLVTRIESQKEFDTDSSIRALESIEDCYYFWARRSQIYHEAFFVSVINIFKDLLKGNYRRFYTGLRGAVRDLISVFLIQ